VRDGETEGYYKVWHGGIAAMRLEEGDQQSEKFQRSDSELEGDVGFGSIVTS